MTAGAIRAGLAVLLSAALVASASAGERASKKTAAERITFYRARTGGPTTYPIYARLGLAYLDRYREAAKARDWEEAVAALRQSLRYQTNFEALLGLAMTLSERHHFGEALPYAEEALRAMPSDIEAAGTLFDVHLALGNIAAADEILQEMLRAQRGFYALSRLAALREYQGDLHGALEAMRDARDAAVRSKFSPNILAWAEVRIGALHIANCERQQARDAYERALRIIPGYAFAREHLAEWHAAQGHWPEAARMFRELLKTNASPAYRLALAEALDARHQAAAAERQRTKAREAMLTAERAGAKDQFRPLALFYLEEGNVAEGLRFARLDQEVRQDALATDTLAWALFRNGQNAEAQDFARQAVQSGNKTPALLLHCGMILCHAGDLAAGRPLIEQALACTLAFGPAERKLSREGVACSTAISASAAERDAQWRTRDNVNNANLEK
ncbi:MAG: tetratricopeptide repeat protein [Nitrospirota bacterium]